MTSTPLVALALALLPQAGGGADASWQALALPSLAADRPDQVPDVPRLLLGRHVRLQDREQDEDLLRPGVHLPVPALLGLLQEDAARRRLALRLQPGAPPLLVRGPANAVAAARELLASLDREGRQLDVEVRAWLTPGAPQLGTRPARAVFEAAVRGVPPLGTARLRSGATAVLGRRRSQGFVSGYTVEIASASSVAGPTSGRVLTGRTLHLRACRVREGRAVALEGFLDVAELSGMESFDPQTPDLGLVQQPRVGSVQIAFSGLVEGDGVLAVGVRGSALRERDWTLWVEARCPTPQGSAAGPADEGWRVRDVAWLEERPLSLPRPGPGAGLERDERGRTLEPTIQPLGAALVAQAADAERVAAARGGRAPIVWAPGLVLAPASETALWAEVQALVEAAESQRLRGAELTVSLGELRVVLPVLEGVPARVHAGVERAVVEGYELQVAPESWMPRPQVGVAFDGLLLQGVLGRDALEGEAWVASSAPLVELDRAQVGLARLQVQDRALATAALRVELGAPASQAIEAEGALPALEVALAAPR